MTTPNRRGRPRNQAARATILRVARELLDEGGIPAVTMEELAARSGVSKPTIYRSWPNAQAVAMAALSEIAPRAAKLSGGSLEHDLKRALRSLVETFQSRAGRNAATLIASADPNTEIGRAFRHHVILKCREQVGALVARGVGEGVVRADVEIDVALDMILAPVFFRLLLGHAPLDEAFADAVVDHALAGLRARGKDARPKPKRTRAASP